MHTLTKENAYLFSRSMMRSGVAASCASFGTRRFASAATLFSLADGRFVAPSAGAPGSTVGSDMTWYVARVFVNGAL